VPRLQVFARSSPEDKCISLRCPRNWDSTNNGKNNGPAFNVQESHCSRQYLRTSILSDDSNINRSTNLRRKGQATNSATSNNVGDSVGAVHHTLQKPSLLPTRPSAPETEVAPPMIYPPLSSLITNGRSFSRRVDGASPMWYCELLGDAVAWLLAIYFGHAGQASFPIFLHMSNFEFQCLPSIQLGTPRCGSN
jgi:hypothetical protein